MIGRRAALVAAAGGLATVPVACLASGSSEAAAEVDAKTREARHKSVRSLIAEFNAGKRDFDLHSYLNILFFTQGGAKQMSVQALIDLHDRSIFRIVDENRKELALASVYFDDSDAVKSIGIF